MGSAEVQIEEPSEAATAAELVLALRGMSRALQTFLIVQARASGLGLLEFLLLARAADRDGVTARDAGRSLGLNTSTMTGLTDRLEQDRLIRRHPHPTDRRMVVLRATARGRKAIDRAFAPLLTDLGQVADALPTEDRALVGSFMGQVGEVVLQGAMAVRPASGNRSITRGSAPRRSRQPGARSVRGGQGSGPP